MIYSLSAALGHSTQEGDLWIIAEVGCCPAPGRAADSLLWLSASHTAYDSSVMTIWNVSFIIAFGGGELSPGS